VNELDSMALVADARDLAMPELILTAFGCLALVIDVILPRRQHRIVAYASLGGVALSFVSVVITWTAGGALPRYGFFDMIVLDDLTLVFKAIVLVALALSIALSIRFLDIESEQRGEYYALMCFATVGMMFLAGGHDLLSLYISLELMALSVYVLVGYLKRNRASNEAAMKYFLLGAFSSGVLLYGMSLLYGLTGTTNLRGIAEALPRLASSSGDADARYLLLVAVVLLAAGLCFKIAAVPFHMWAPDAYEGAPTPVTAFMSVGVKAASFAFFMRLFLDGIPGLRSLDDASSGGLPGWGAVLGIVAAVTMTWGNLGALTQKNAKRLLAYSSIAHAGYLLLGILAGNEHGYTGLVIYLIVYVFMNLGAFGVLIALHRRGIEGDRIEDFNGLAQRAPGLAALMTIFLLSLGGIPPTAGFIGKFYLFYGLVDSGDPWLIRLALLALLNTAVSAYYYLLFVKAMFMGEADDEAPTLETSGGVWATVGIAAVLTIGIGVYPQPAIAISKRAVERVRPAVVRTDGGSVTR
jgi:NADH-quinone oxidoreductase subunit N